MAYHYAVLMLLRSDILRKIAIWEFNSWGRILICVERKGKEVWHLKGVSFGRAKQIIMKKILPSSSRKFSFVFFWGVYGTQSFHIIRKSYAFCFIDFSLNCLKFMVWVGSVFSIQLGEKFGEFRWIGKIWESFLR